MLVGVLVRQTEARDDLHYHLDDITSEVTFFSESISVASTSFLGILPTCDLFLCSRIFFELELQTLVNTIYDLNFQEKFFVFSFELVPWIT